MRGMPTCLSTILPNVAIPMMDYNDIHVRCFH